MITRQQLAAMIDYTLLAPEAGREDVKRLCEEARRYEFGHVCVNPRNVALASALLRGSGVGVCSVVGFPLGATLPEIKAAEARRVVELGASEVDMVLDVAALKDGEDFRVVEDIAGVVRAASVAVKVILETCLLTEEEKRRACALALEGGAAFVKTSTGFGRAGATVDDVKLMRSVVGDRAGVKAAGGIRSFDTACEMIRAGATRIGTSHGPAILNGWRPVDALM
ncbi:MAG: deoxyribose-phosphate aldolase [Thermoplasmata archaeon]